MYVLKGERFFGRMLPIWINVKFFHPYRYLKKRISGKPTANKRMMYFLATSRLQRLYATKILVEKMRWHLKNPRVHASLEHSCDAEAWKHPDDA